MQWQEFVVIHSVLNSGEVVVVVVVVVDLYSTSRRASNAC